MSVEYRQNVLAIVAEIVRVAGQEDVSAEQERELALRAINLAAMALCDLNRIADALEVLALPPEGHEPRQSGKWVWVETEPKS